MFVSLSLTYSILLWQEFGEKLRHTTMKRSITLQLEADQGNVKKKIKNERRAALVYAPQCTSQLSNYLQKRH